MSLFQWTFVTTAMVMSLLFFPSHLGAAKDAQLLLSGDLHKVNEPFTVTVVNPGPKDMWFCVQVAKTILHPDSQDRPIPIFTVRYRKSKGTKWGDLLWGRDYGGLEVPELLGAGENRSYQIGLPQPGMYQLGKNRGESWTPIIRSWESWNWKEKGIVDTHHSPIIRIVQRIFESAAGSGIVKQM